MIPLVVNLEITHDILQLKVRNLLLPVLSQRLPSLLVL
jgi:hypothetical protein